MTGYTPPHAQVHVKRTRHGEPTLEEQAELQKIMEETEKIQAELAAATDRISAQDVTRAFAESSGETGPGAS